MTLVFLFTFAIGNAWAADPAIGDGELPSATLDISDFAKTVKAGAKDKYKVIPSASGTTATDQPYYVLVCDSLRQEYASKTTNLPWVYCKATNGGGSHTLSYADGLTDADKLGFVAATRSIGINSDRYHNYRVKNCTSVTLLNRSNNTSGERRIWLNVFKYNTATKQFEFNTTIKSDYNSSNDIVVNASLDAGSEYVIQVTSGSTSNSKAVEIRFIGVASSAEGDYNATYESAKGTPPDNEEDVASVTLAEITGVEGFTHVGWTADKAVTVDEEEVSAGTLIANGKTATLGADTKFTAVWKTEINPTLSYDNPMLVLTKLTSAVPTLTGNTGSGAVTWSSSAEGVATVDGSGIVTAVAAGTAEITATIAASGEYAAGEAKATIKVVAAPTHLIENVLDIANGASWGSYIITNDYSNISNLSAFNPSRTGDGAINVNKKNANGSRSSNISSYDTENAENYMVLAFKVADGYALNVSAISVQAFSVGNEKQHRAWITDADGNKIVEGTKTLAKDACENVFGDVDFSSTSVSLTGVNYLKLWTWGNTDGYRLNTPIYIDGEIISTTPVAPAITAPTEDQSAEYNVGNTITPLAVTATGYPAPTYQWYYNSSASTEGATSLGSGAQTASYTPANDAASDLYYYCVVTNTSGSDTSPYFHVTVNSCAKPGTPANLAAGSITYNSAALSWDEAANADGYQISIIKKDDASEVIPWTACATNSYAAADLAQGTEYTFKVKAKGATGYCEFGLEAEADFTTTAPSVADLVTIADDWTFTPSAAIAGGTLAEGGKLFSAGEGNTWSSGLVIKTNRSLAFKVAANAKVKVTFTENNTRKMQVGSDLSAGNYDTYGSSNKSPLIVDVAAGGVVYLTADGSNQLSMTKLEITYPHNVTYALNGGDGTLPTESAHYVGDKFNLHDGEDGITAPTDKEFAGWNDGTTTYIGGAEYTMGASAVTLTAQWATPLPEPTITFNNGAYTIGGAALDLSTLFASNSDGAVTYSVKTAGETGAAIDGTNFSATAAGSAVVTATQAATASYKTKSVDATITISAPSEIDGIKLVEDGVLTGNFRTSASLKDQERTIKGITYSKYINLSSRSSWGSQPAGPDNYLLQYTLTKKTNTFYFYAYNKNSGSKSIKVYVKEEGENIVTKTIDIPAGKGDLLSCEVNVTKNAEVLISHTSGDVQICQVVVVESGDALLLAPEVGYNISFNKGRLTAKQNTAKTFEGMTYCNNADYKIDNSSNLKLTTRGTHYVSFEIPTGQTRQLQVTTGGGAYNVSKVLGDDKKATVTGNNNINLGAGTWYINPQGSDVTITNLKFVAAPASMTIAFNSNGGSDVESQLLFVGDNVAEPEAPEKAGYRFVKWQKSGVDYDFDYTLVAGDAPGFTLDAVWQETVTVTFAPANGEDDFTKTADKGAVLAAGDRPADPERAGYVFQGWTRDASAEPVVYVDLASETFSADATLTAVWEVAQTDATISALSYNGNAINVASAEDVDGVATYTVHLQWGTAIDKDLISVTKTASSATVGPIAYDSEAKKATFTVTAGDGTTTADYAIQFVIDAKRGTSIIKATTNNVVTGLIGGTIDQSYSGNANSRKLNKTNYFGVTLANDETFQEGDVFIVNIATAADLGKFMVFADKDRTELIADQGIVYTKPDVASPVVCPTGEMMLVLPAAANGKKSLYLSRENVDNSEQWNVTFSYIEVTREMAPAIKSFKFGDDAATINESAKTITYEVAYGTDVTALTPTVEAYGNNGATYTPDGATNFTNPVVYTVTDAYNELHTDYTVTVNIAAPSTNAYLASLSVAGYTLDFNKEVEDYNIVLDYGTTVLPEITYAVEDAGLATAVKVENGVNGATTITVTPQAGESYKKVYTINFSVSTTPKIVIYDGSTTMNIAETGSLAGFAWSIKDSKTLEKSSKDRSFDGKAYPYFVNLFGSATKGDNDGNTRYIEMTVPEGYVAKFRLVGGGNGEGSRSLFISKTKGGTLDPSIAYATTSSADYVSGMSSALQLPGTYYLCCDNSIRLCELSVQLYPIDYSRDVTEGRYGTICLPNGGVMVGATLYEVAYYGQTSKKIFFDEILNGEMEAGVPYIFLPKEGASQLAVYYTDEANESAKNANGLHGFIGANADAEMNVPVGAYILNANQYREVVTLGTAKIKSNRSYIELGEISPSEPALAPGRRRISMSVYSEQVATGIENTGFESEAPRKVLINGELYIIRGEKMYDAKGQLVK